MLSSISQQHLRRCSTDSTNCQTSQVGLVSPLPQGLAREKLAAPGGVQARVVSRPADECTLSILVQGAAEAPQAGYVACPDSVFGIEAVVHGDPLASRPKVPLQPRFRERHPRLRARFEFGHRPGFDLDLDLCHFLLPSLAPLPRSPPSCSGLYFDSSQKNERLARWVASCLPLTMSLHPPGMRTCSTDSSRTSNERSKTRPSGTRAGPGTAYPCGRSSNGTSRHSARRSAGTEATPRPRGSPVWRWNDGSW